MRPCTDVGRLSTVLGIGVIVSALVAIAPPVQAFPGIKAAPSGAPAASGSAGSGAAAQARLVNINTASRAELKTLPGIGDAEAERIVANRPYATKTHLVEKQVLSLDAYDKLRKAILVEHRRLPTR